MAEKEWEKELRALLKNYLNEEVEASDIILFVYKLLNQKNGNNEAD